MSYKAVENPRLERKRGEQTWYWASALEHHADQGSQRDGCSPLKGLCWAHCFFSFHARKQNAGRNSFCCFLWSVCLAITVEYVGFFFHGPEWLYILFCFCTHTADSCVGMASEEFPNIISKHFYVSEDVGHFGCCLCFINVQCDFLHESHSSLTLECFNNSHSKHEKPPSFAEQCRRLLMNNLIVKNSVDPVVLILIVY